jgi:drug/metabolite transporter (DMT)-like permease
MSPLDLLLLLVANLFWAINPTAGKVLIAQTDPLTTAWLRYAGAALALAAAWPWIRGAGACDPETPRPLPLRDKAIVAAIGATTCFLAPLCQMSGLGASTAVSNSILMTTEPLFTLLLAWLLLRGRLTRQESYMMAVAAAGALVLSGIFSSTGLCDIPRALRQWSRGDLLLLAAIFCEACYSVLPKMLAGRYPGPRIYAPALAVGFSLLSVTAFLHGGPHLVWFSARGWLAFFWLGPFGTTLTYLFWLHLVQRGIPLPALAATLYFQPVIGAAAGMIVLHEPLRRDQMLGGALILAAVTWYVWQDMRARPQATGGA